MDNVMRIGAVWLMAVMALAPTMWPVSDARAAANTWWYKGASFVPNGTEDFGSDGFRQSVRDFKAAGGTYVNFIVPYYQSNTGSSDIQRGYNTPSDAALISGIEYVHSLGLRAQISIFLESWSGEWRAEINPGDRDGWFRNYGDVLVRYGALGKNYGVELLQLGAELVRMTSASLNADNTSRWQNLIGRVRAAYGGKLTYSANRGQQGWASELPNIQFWDRLDYIGVSAYYELGGDSSVTAMQNAWQNVENYDVKPMRDKWGKPIIFTEVGYRSVSGAQNQPWNSWMGGSYDPQVQSNAYQALFNFWGARSYMQGMALWWWSPDPNAGGSGDTDYTPQNKLAEGTIKNAWSGGGGQPPPAQPPPSGTPAFTASGSAPSHPNQGSSVTLTASIKDTGDAAGSIIVDMEVWQGGSRVFQKFVEGQSFAAGATKQFSASWTPSGTGEYTLKVGVFGGGWSPNYAWNDSAAAITVGPSNSSGQAGSAATNIWWPTDGARVSGIVPFKAMLEGRDVSTYSMYWRVGGGGLVEMYNSNQDYPHKEALVDLSAWNWLGAGPYPITFVSKDSGGSTIGSKTINIWIP